MADFVFAFGAHPRGRLSKVLGAALDGTAACREYVVPAGTLAVASAPHDDDVVTEEQGRLAVLVGRPFHGDAVATPGTLLRLCRRGGDSAWDRGKLDGPYAALSTPPDGDTVVVITDLLGLVPVFHGPGVVGTHARAVAALCGAEPDPVSAADFAMRGAITFPYTFFRDVRELAPSSVHRVRPTGTALSRFYWLPEEQLDRFADIQDAAAAIREGVRGCVHRLAASCDRLGLLLSAGEDSRAVLGTACCERPTESYHFADEGPEGRETALARRVARAYGVDLCVGYRKPTAYLDAFHRMTCLVDAQHEFMEGHSVVVAASLALSGLPAVLTGHLADRLLKPVAPLERVPRTEGFRRDIEHEVWERRTTRFATIDALRPGSADTWAYCWPFSQGVSAGFRHSNRRLFRIAEPFMANDVIVAAAGVRQEWKVDLRLFRRAVRPFLTRAWYLPHPEPRLPWFGPLPNRLLGLMIRAARKAGRIRDPRMGANHGPWPAYRRLVAAEALAPNGASSRDNPARDLLANPDCIPERWGPLKRLRWLQLTRTWGAASTLGSGGLSP
jgi:hypothetical protein